MIAVFVLLVCLARMEMRIVNKTELLIVLKS